MKPVLVINDDPEILSTIVSFLKKENYFHLAASNASQALTMASGYDFELVILDLKLPDMDGDELYDKLIECESHYELSVLALLDTLDGDEVKVLNKLTTKGRVTLFPKPLDIAELARFMDQLGVERKS